MPEKEPTIGIFTHPRLIGETSRGYLPYESDQGIVFMKFGPIETALPEAVRHVVIGEAMPGEESLVPVLQTFSRQGERGIMLFDYIDPGHIADSRESYAGAVAGLLNRLHAADMEMLEQAASLPVKTRHWYEHALENRLNSIYEHGLISGNERRLLGGVMSRIYDRLGWDRVWPVHGDFAPHNFVVRQTDTEKVAYVFDFEHTALGHRLEDWGRLLLFYRTFDPELHVLLSGHCPDTEGARAFELLQSLFLTAHYARKHEHSNQDEHARMAKAYWLIVSQSLAANRPIPENVRRQFVYLDDKLLLSERARSERKNYMPAEVFS